MDQLLKQHWLSYILSIIKASASVLEHFAHEAHETPLEIRKEKLALQYILILKANSGNPAYDVVFNPKYQNCICR